MAVGIIIHVSVGKESRTEFFGEENIRIGADEASELQIHTKKIKQEGVWLEFERENGIYRLINFNENLTLKHNKKPLRNFC